MTAITPQEFYEFEQLVNESNSQTEIECAKYLHFAAGYLLPQTPENINFAREDRHYYGSTDFVLAAKLRNDALAEETVAYIWELKAPQCFLFEYDDNNNRCRPTKDLIKAENQLLHYLDQAIGDQSFRVRFGVMETKNIRAGGIIIGRSTDKLLKSIRDDGDKFKAQKALEVRRSYFYLQNNIRVITWDRILDFVKP